MLIIGLSGSASIGLHDFEKNVPAPRSSILINKIERYVVLLLNNWRSLWREFSNGKYNGTETYIFEDKDTCKSTFQKGQLNGSAVCDYFSGDTYMKYKKERYK